MLLDINIKEEQRFARIHWKDEFYNTPFFECAATDSGKVERQEQSIVGIKKIVMVQGSPLLQTSTIREDFRRLRPVSRRVLCLILSDANIKLFKIKST